jgi:hypothetical protein
MTGPKVWAPVPAWSSGAIQWRDLFQRAEWVPFLTMNGSVTMTRLPNLSTKRLLNREEGTGGYRSHPT